MRRVGSNPPAGTVTFLFSDIEGSTQLLGRLGEQWGPALEDHRRLLRAAFAGHGGYEVDKVDISAVAFWAALIDAYIPQARAALPGEADSVYAEGRVLPLEQAVAEALGET